MIRGCVVGVGHVDLIFREEGGIVGDEQVPEAGVVGACMGLATSEGGLLLVDTINVVMTEGVAGVAFENGSHELYVTRHGLHFHLSPKRGACVARSVGDIWRGGSLYFVFVERTHEDIRHETKEAAVLLATLLKGEGNGVLLGGLLFVLIETERTGRPSEVVVENGLLIDEVI